MHKEDGIIKLIDGEVYYKFDYANFLYEELQKKDDEIDKYKNVIDKIKEKINENRYGNGELCLDNQETIKLLELLEEVDGE